MRLTRVFLSISVLSSTACAYKFGLSNRALPGGYSELAVPVFRNDTPEVGIETLFTNSLVRRFERSQVASVTPRDSAPLILEGAVRDLAVTMGPQVTNANSLMPSLPDNAVLTTEFRVAVTAQIRLRRRSDDKIVWESSFKNERVYQAPRVGVAVVNSANATYNQSVRNHTMAQIADEMMAEAHDRMTENF